MLKTQEDTINVNQNSLMELITHDRINYDDGNVDDDVDLDKKNKNQPNASQIQQSFNSLNTINSINIQKLGNKKDNNPSLIFMTNNYYMNSPVINMDSVYEKKTQTKIIRQDIDLENQYQQYNKSQKQKQLIDNTQNDQDKEEDEDQQESSIIYKVATTKSIFKKSGKSKSKTSKKQKFSTKFNEQLDINGAGIQEQPKLDKDDLSSSSSQESSSENSQNQYNSNQNNDLNSQKIKDIRKKSKRQSLAIERFEKKMLSNIDGFESTYQTSLKFNKGKTILAQKKPANFNTVPRVTKHWKIIQILAKIIGKINQLNSLHKNFLLIHDWGSKISNDQEIDYYYDNQENQQQNKSLVIKHKKSQVKYTCGQKIFNFYKSVTIMDSNSRLSLYWDCQQILLNLFVVFLFSVNLLVGFGEDIFMDESIQTQIFVLLVIISFIGDIIKELKSSYFQKGLIISDHLSIFKKYFKGIFFFDLMSLLSISWWYYGHQKYYREYFWIGYILRCLIFLKIKPLATKLTRVRKFFSQKETTSYSIELLTLIFYILVLAHFVAIVYQALGAFQITILKIDADTWFHQSDIDNYQEISYWIRYLKSFFSSTSSMVTVLIYFPLTIPEYIFLTIIMIFNCGIFGYSINELGNIMMSIQKHNKDLKQDLNLINRYMEKQNISKDLQSRIRNYIEYIFDQKLDMDMESTQNVINTLSTTLKDELDKNVKNQHILKIKFFTNNFTNISIDNLYQYVETVSYTTGDIIFQQDIKDDEAFYYITKGSVELFHDIKRREIKKTQIAVLEKGHTFGEYTFFTGNGREINAKALEYTTLLKFTKEQILNAFQDNRDIDYEKFCQIKDKMTMNNEYFRINLSCFSCNSSRHFVKECPNVHLILNKQKTILQVVNLTQERRKFSRNIFNKQDRNSLKNQQEMEEDMEFFYSYFDKDLDVYEERWKKLSPFWLMDIEDNDLTNNDSPTKDFKKGIIPQLTAIDGRRQSLRNDDLFKTFKTQTENFRRDMNTGSKYTSSVVTKSKSQLTSTYSSSSESELITQYKKNQNNMNASNQQQQQPQRQGQRKPTYQKQLSSCQKICIGQQKQQVVERRQSLHHTNPNLIQQLINNNNNNNNINQQQNMNQQIETKNNQKLQQRRQSIARQGSVLQQYMNNNVKSIHSVSKYESKSIYSKSKMESIKNPNLSVRMDFIPCNDIILDLNIMLLPDLDVMYKYKTYMPYNNYQIVIEGYSQYQKFKQARQDLISQKTNRKIRKVKTRRETLKSKK